MKKVLLSLLVLISIIPTEGIAKGMAGRAARGAMRSRSITRSVPKAHPKPSSSPIVVEQKSSSFMPFITGALVGNAISSSNNSVPQDKEKKEEGKK